MRVKTHIFANPYVLTPWCLLGRGLLPTLLGGRSMVLGGAEHRSESQSLLGFSLSKGSAPIHFSENVPIPRPKFQT